MFKKIKRYARGPYYALGYDMIKKYPRLMSDRFYVKTLWLMIMGYKLDLKNPKTFNEKLQWLKLFDHKPLYTTLVDKYRVKQYVANLIGPEHIIPTLAVYKDVNEIKLENLPNQFVLKCNHDSGSVIICQDKNSFDFEAAKLKLSKAMRHNFYWDAREWAYKHVKRVIFAEQYMENTSSLYDDNKDLLTYKFMCFNGNPYLCYVTVKNDHIWENYYDLDFKPLDIHRIYPNSNFTIIKPKCFDQMKEIAKTLSDGLAHIRLDLYEVNGEVFFSEYTFYDWGGLMKFKPDKYDRIMGELIQLNR